MRTTAKPHGVSAPTVKFMKTDPKAVLPARQHPTDAGFDLASIEPARTLHPGDHAVFDTGIAVALPPNTVGLVYVRSSLGFKHGVTLSNSVGVIDHSFRGTLKVSLVHHGNETISILPGDRIAQLVVTPLVSGLVSVEVESLDETDRGAGGFGSTGR